MHKQRRPGSGKVVLYCACAAAVFGAVWLVSGLLKAPPNRGHEEVCLATYQSVIAYLAWSCTRLTNVVRACTLRRLP